MFSPRQRTLSQNGSLVLALGGGSEAGPRPEGIALVRNSPPAPAVLPGVGCWLQEAKPSGHGHRDPGCLPVKERPRVPEHDLWGPFPREHRRAGRCPEQSCRSAQAVLPRPCCALGGRPPACVLVELCLRSHATPTPAGLQAQSRLCPCGQGHLCTNAQHGSWCVCFWLRLLGSHVRSIRESEVTANSTWQPGQVHPHAPSPRAITASRAGDPEALQHCARGLLNRNLRQEKHRNQGRALNRPGRGPRAWETLQPEGAGPLVPSANVRRRADPLGSAWSAWR